MRPLLDDAFGHHVWATIRLIDGCSRLSPPQLETPVPGTYGSILDTMRHLVGADSRYLEDLTGGVHRGIDEEHLGLMQLRVAIETDGVAWSTVLEGDLDADAIIVTPERDGSENREPVGVFLAQALHHGTDHRSQICTALTTLGVEPPPIDAWDFGFATGRSVFIRSTS
jgi:uncharacterized damage-inducible protein DinB